jgi:hypothetical protein
MHAVYSPEDGVLYLGVSGPPTPGAGVMWLRHMNVETSAFATTDKAPPPQSPRQQDGCHTPRRTSHFRIT